MSKKEKENKKENSEKENSEKEASGKKKKKGFLEKISSKMKKDNFWKYSVFVLLAILLLWGIFFFKSGCTGKVILEEEEAQEELSEFLGGMIQEGEIDFISSNDLGDVYEFTVSYEGNTFPQYITKNGGYYIPELVSISEVQSSQEQPSQEESGVEEAQIEEESTTDYSEEEIASLKEFNDCLSENGLVFYGSNTCPHCRNLIETLGGYEAAESVYVECTENREICSQEAKTGYVPEIQIDGAIYEGKRTIESFSEATGCPAPEL